jgi:hypothetical protein
MRDTRNTGAPYYPVVHLFIELDKYIQIRSIVGFCAAGGVIRVIVMPATAQAGNPSWATCTDQAVPVFLSPTNPTKYVVHGRLCLRADNASRNKTIQLMVAGITYDQNLFNSSQSRARTPTCSRRRAADIPRGVSKSLDLRLCC